jgi:Protein of unknown function (DUF2971)
MRLYHFLKAEHALDDIRKKRIKISLIPDLNDPFEINSIRQPTLKHRSIWTNFINDLGKRFGVICFSKEWDNPLLWSHYADKHYGICLGFETTSKLAEKVKYRKSKLPYELNLDHPTGGLGDEEMQEILITKYAGWIYEDEMRVLAKLESSEPHPDDPTKFLYFADFSSELQLREVIVGVRSKVKKEEVESALVDYDNRVKIKKARLAFNSFRVVQNLKGFVS